MEIGIVTALIGAIGLIVGTAIASIVQYFSSKNKLEELRISYSQKAYDRQIESARAHLDDLYLPLYKEISSLLYNYTKYRNIYRITEESNKKQTEDFEELKNLLDSISKFNEVVEGIFKSGMTAYLVGVIEDRLIDLRDLLERSKENNAPIVKTNVITTTVTSSFLGLSSSINMQKQLKKVPRTKLPKILEIDVKAWPVSVTTRTEMKLLKAPLHSEAFETEFMNYITQIKNDIREITLWIKK